MFKVGDVLMVNPKAAEAEYAPYKNTGIYSQMMAAVEKHRFEVVGKTDTGYQLRRNDGVEYSSSNNDVHSYFVLAS